MSDSATNWGVVFGLIGIGISLISVIYARTQAIHARRQADTSYVATSLQLQREMSDRIYKTRTDLMRDPIAANMYVAEIPELANLVGDASRLNTLVTIRNAIDGLQDMYFMRKRSIIDDHHWRNWITSFVVLARMPVTRALFDSAVSREALEPEFVAFVQPLFEGRLPDDPVRSDA